MSKSKTMALAINTPTADILSKLEAEIASLKHVQETAYKAGTNLSQFGNIQSETSIPKLIQAFSTVVAKETAYDKAAEELGLSSYPVFSVDGYAKAEWKHDIQLRMDVINFEERLKKLNEFKSKMTAFLSASEQKEMLIAEMAKYLG